MCSSNTTEPQSNQPTQAATQDTSDFELLFLLTVAVAAIIAGYLERVEVLGGLLALMLLLLAWKTIPVSTLLQDSN
jgi:hypothetical protein